MAKQTAKSKKRAVTGSSRKSKASKLNTRTFVFGLVGVLAFSVVAGLGWQKWQDHQLEAQAASRNYHLIAQDYSGPGRGAAVYACKDNPFAQGGKWYYMVYLKFSNPTNVKTYHYFWASSYIPFSGSDVAPGKKVYLNPRPVGITYKWGALAQEYKGGGSGVAAPSQSLSSIGDC